VIWGREGECVPANSLKSSGDVPRRFVKREEEEVFKESMSRIQKTRKLWGGDPSQKKDNSGFNKYSRKAGVGSGSATFLRRGARKGTEGIGKVLTSKCRGDEKFSLL